MESVVEDIEDERQTEGSPANSQSCKKLVGWFFEVFSIQSQHDDDIDSEANNKTICSYNAILIPFKY